MYHIERCLSKKKKIWHLLNEKDDLHLNTAQSYVDICQMHSLKELRLNKMRLLMYQKLEHALWPKENHVLLYCTYMSP